MKVDMFITRYTLVNVMGGIGLVTFFFSDLFDDAMTADSYHLVKLIFVVFLFSLYRSVVLAMDLNAGLNTMDRGMEPKELELVYYKPIQCLRNYASILVMLGLIGTVWGFIVAFGVVGSSDITNVDNVAPVIGGLMEGMNIALYTTLAGSVFALWVNILYQVIKGGTDQLNRGISIGE